MDYLTKWYTYASTKKIPKIFRIKKSYFQVHGKIYELWNSVNVGFILPKKKIKEETFFLTYENVQIHILGGKIYDRPPLPPGCPLPPSLMGAGSAPQTPGALDCLDSPGGSRELLVGGSESGFHRKPSKIYFPFIMFFWWCWKYHFFLF